MADVAGEASIGNRLITYLRTRLDRPALDFLEPVQALTGGFDATIYRFQLKGAPPDYSPRLIVRIFPTHAAERARREGAFQGAVAAAGYAAPRIIHVCLDEDVLGGAFVIMPLVPGKRLIDAVLRPSLFALRAPALLAEAQARLHNLDPLPIHRALETANIDPGPQGTGAMLRVLREAFDHAPDEGLRPGLDWLEGHLPPDTGRHVICHLDFHPLNVLVDDGHVTGVVDWANVHFGEPAADVGTTMMVLTLGPLDVPAPLRAVSSAGRRWAAGRYLREYRRLRPVPMERVEYHEALRCYMALQHASERLAGTAATLPGTTYAWGGPEEVAALVRRFQALTGVVLDSVRLPLAGPTGRDSLKR